MFCCIIELNMLLLFGMKFSMGIPKPQDADDFCKTQGLSAFLIFIKGEILCLQV